MKKLIPVVLLAALVSCDFGGGKVKQQNDSLMLATAEKDRQMNSLVGTLIEIDDNLQKIKEKENIISLNVTSGETTGQALEERINQDIQLIYDLMLQNKEKIAQLEKSLQQSGANNANLNKLVTRLNQQLKEKTLEIIELKQQLEDKSLQITALNFTIEGMQTYLDSLQALSQSTQQQLDKTTQNLYRGYYAFGSKKELKDQNIISSDGIFSKQKVLSEDFSKEYFTEIDIRQVDSLPLYKSKAKLLTAHPESAYTLEPGDDGALTLRINDKDAFWSLSKYLVVQLN